MGDETLNTGKGGVVADGVDLDPDRRVGGDGAGDYLVSAGLGDGSGLAGDHRFVNFCGTVHDDTVGGDAPAGTDQHGVADGEFGGGHRFGASIDDSLGFVGEKLGEGG